VSDERVRLAFGIALPASVQPEREASSESSSDDDYDSDYYF
jgi:hypothetical protein